MTYLSMQCLYQLALFSTAAAGEFYDLLARRRVDDKPLICRRDLRRPAATEEPPHCVQVLFEIVFQNGGFYSCLECITMVVSEMRLLGAATSDSPHCVCRSHWLHSRRPHVMATRPR